MLLQGLEFQSTLSSQRVTSYSERGGHYLTFQSTLSSQRVTILFHHSFLCFCISIHTLLAESDGEIHEIWAGFKNFNPHSPRREWQAYKIDREIVRNFNPHSPRREWHDSQIFWCQPGTISIHTLLAESDSNYGIVIKNCKISIHTLLAESDCSWWCFNEQIIYFNPHSPRREWPLSSS